MGWACGERSQGRPQHPAHPACRPGTHAGKLESKGLRGSLPTVNTAGNRDMDDPDRPAAGTGACGKGQDTAVAPGDLTQHLVSVSARCVLGPGGCCGRGHLLTVAETPRDTCSPCRSYPPPPRNTCSPSRLYPTPPPPGDTCSPHCSHPPGDTCLPRRWTHQHRLHTPHGCAGQVCSDPAAWHHHCGQDG